MTFFEYRAACANLASQEELEWQRTSLIASIIANQNRGKGKRPLQPDDFNPYSDKLRGNKNADKDVENALKLAEEMKNRFKNG